MALIALVGVPPGPVGRGPPAVARPAHVADGTWRGPCRAGSFWR
ncbi:hypothetical protein ACH4A8_30985 [Streptomyces vietnamensis]